MVANVLMLHGINHNMFGKRDPRQYGTATLADIDQASVSYTHLTLPTTPYV